MIPDHRWENLFSDLFIYCRQSQSDYSVMTNQTGKVFFLNHAAFMSHIISPSLLTFFTHWLIYYNFFFFFGSSFLWNQRHHEGTLNLMNPMLFGMIRATAGETLHCIPVQRAHIYIQPSSSQLWACFFFICGLLLKASLKIQGLFSMYLITVIFNIKSLWAATAIIKSVLCQSSLLILTLLKTSPLGYWEWIQLTGLFVGRGAKKIIALCRHDPICLFERFELS